MRIPSCLTTVVAAAAAVINCSSLALEPAAAPEKSRVARLQFDPNGKAWTGETAFKGASWTSLNPGLEKGVLMLQARAGVGDSFPVQEKSGKTLFTVKLAEGNDSRLVLEISAKEQESRKVELARDKRAEVEISGTKYELLFPTTSVAAATDEKPSTNKATVIVTRRL
jgi:hypothetical protein